MRLAALMSAAGATAMVAVGLMASVSARQGEEAEPAGLEPYTQVCGMCHGPEGTNGEAPPIVPLAYDGDYVLAIVREGYGQMPPISTRELTDEQVMDVVRYLEALSGM